MRNQLKNTLILLALIGMAGCTVKPGAAPSPATTHASSTPISAAGAGTPEDPGSPLALVSLDSLLGFVEDLTAIQPYSGWRNSASSGEREALDYAAETLGGYAFLREMGMELERQEFNVFISTELRETRLELTVGCQIVEVPADGLRGDDDLTDLAIRFDSDGAFNDDQPDPVVVQGAALVARTKRDIQKLTAADVNDRIVFLDYTAIDRALLGTNTAVGIAWDLAAKNPAGIVMVTEYSSQKGASHGSFVGDGSAFTWVEAAANPPVLYVRLEDLGEAGIQSWKDLKKIESARLTWDADLFSPGRSGNLIARVPGEDSTRAMIVGAHIDSPNAPGAMDDGSGSAILLEIARVLNAARLRPPTDLYLVWFGSEELGLYGSQHFANTHQELLDRTTAMLQIDDLTRPLDGIQAEHHLVTWSYGRFGADEMAWPRYLAGAAAGQGLAVKVLNVYSVYSDNHPFSGYDVPNANLIYMNLEEMNKVGGVWPGGQIHNPYDTIALAREMGPVFREMAQIALTAVLSPPAAEMDLRFPDPPARRAVVAASHTESPHLTPSTLTELGMALAVNGWDVDLLPYGQPVTPADLAGAGLVIVPPVFDYPTAATGDEQYDTGWSAAEVDALEEYTRAGGLLVIANSRHRMKYGLGAIEPNEDALDMNALAERFGVTFTEGAVAQSSADARSEHPLMAGVVSLDLSPGNGVPFAMAEGEALALAASGTPVVGLAQAGQGEVVVLADAALLNNEWGSQRNTALWENLARYAAGR